MRSDTEKALRRHWGAWLKAVGAYANRNGRGAGTAPEAYPQLHAQLLAPCQLMAERGGAERSFFESLADLVAPWGSLELLARSDGEILASLWERCRQADLRLRGNRRRDPA